MTSKNVLSRLRDELTNLHAYAVHDANGLVKLDAMENPFSLPEELRAQWTQCLNQAAINRYPEPSPAGLKQKLKDCFGPQSGSDLLLGNGSDELIQLLALAVAKPGASILTVSPSFSMYEMIADMVGIKVHVVPLTKQYELDLTAMLECIVQIDPALIFLAYPNNPTGNLWDRAAIVSIVQASRGIVVIDEAYGPFANASFSEELQHYPNMVLLRTASKLGLAGIRFGWLAGPTALIAELDKLRLPYNINVLTQRTMSFALDHYKVFAEQAQQICTLRSELYRQLAQLEGVQAYPTAANFVLFKTLSKNATDVYQLLLANKVLIKNLSMQVGLEQCLRVTVGSKQENDIFIRMLTQILIG